MRVFLALFAASLVICSSSQMAAASPSQNPHAAPLNITVTVDLGFEGAVRVGVPTPISVTVSIDASAESIPVVVELETFDSMYRTHVKADSFIDGQFTWNILTHRDDPWVYVSVYDMDGVLLATGDATARSMSQTTVLGVGSTLFEELSSWVEDGGQLLGTHRGTTGSDGTIQLVDSANALTRPTQLNALAMVVLSGVELGDLSDAHRVLLHEWVTFGGELIVVTSGDDASQLVSLLSGSDEDSVAVPATLPANLRYRIGLGSVRILSRDEGPAWPTLLERPGLSTDQMSELTSLRAEWSAADHEFVETNHVPTRTLAMGLAGFVLVMGPIVWGVARLLSRPMFVGSAVAVIGIATAMSLLTYSARTHESRETFPLTAMELIGQSARIETVLPFISSTTIDVADSVVMRDNPISADRFGEAAGRRNGVRIQVSDAATTLRSVAQLGSPAAAHLERVAAQHDAIVSVDVLSNDGSTVILEITNVARTILHDVAIAMNGVVVVIEQLDVGRPYEVVIAPPLTAAEPELDLNDSTSVHDLLVELPGEELLGRSLTPLPMNASLITVTGRWPQWEPSAPVISDSVQTLFASHGPGELYFRQAELVSSPVEIQLVGASDRFVQQSISSETDDLDGATAERSTADTNHWTYRLTIPGTIASVDATPTTLQCETTEDVVNVEFFNDTSWVQAVSEEGPDGDNPRRWSIETVGTTGAAYLNVESQAQDQRAKLPEFALLHCEVSP